MNAPLLSVRELTVRYGGDTAPPVVDALSFDLFPGEALAVVGESGSGKSQAFLAALGLLETGGRAAGEVRYRGRDLLGMPRARLDVLRGSELAMIFQDPMSALNPSMRLAAQLTEAARHHLNLGAAEAQRRAAQMLTFTGVPDAARRLRAYPHELSGGLRQRAAIAMALLCGPKVLIADEPTTALDATVQAQILVLLAGLRRKFSLALAVVTHDLGVVAGLCDRMLVMYAGREMESGTVAEIFANPRHPYTAGLLASTPRMDTARPGARLPMIPGAPPEPGGTAADSCPFAPRCPHVMEACSRRRPPLAPRAAGGRAACHMHDDRDAQGVKGQNGAGAAGIDARTMAGVTLGATPPSAPDALRPRVESGESVESGEVSLLSATGLTVAYRVRRGLFSSAPLRALTAATFSLAPRETLGVVGESGCGKSTLARAVLRLIAPTSGSVRLEGEDLSALSPKELRARRRVMQMVFQDPPASLDPRMTAGEIVAEPLRVFAPQASPGQRRAQAREMLARTGLPQSAAGRYPHEFSGGQAQRVGIARALVCAPRLLVCDEPVSALDVSVQAQILNLLADLRDRESLGMLFITHDLSVARAVSDRVMVLYLGRIMEVAPAAALFDAPRHPYTRGLLASAPPSNPRAALGWRPPELAGEPPSPLAPPSGCVFRLRCARAQAQCAHTIPPLETTEDGRQVACLRWREG